ncbi:CueP family metal-binding protein [Corynebacterium urealyticum]|uniref:CueP family metal-binding protein n=1 Tax=Corynebacterium urealyticum TaxID=43771 RepID=UPI00293F5F16|nr:CueP family metal-binding protein [Corynebacterium urealyticum]WOH94236.1 CueP family metal-binding protein [Corynebacterium urealyticum]
MRKTQLPFLLAAVTLGLAGCASSDDPSTDTATSAVETQSQENSQTTPADILAPYSLEDRNVDDVVDALDQMPVNERPEDLIASVRIDQLELSTNEGSAAMDMPEDKTYVSFAPYVDSTHPCTFHSLTTCQGEMRNAPIRIKITESGSNRVLADESVKTFDNGFYGVWLPRDIEGKIEVTHEGKTGSADFSTKANGATCVTDLKLS